MFPGNFRVSWIIAVVWEWGFGGTPNPFFPLHILWLWGCWVSRLLHILREDYGIKASQCNHTAWFLLVVIFLNKHSLDFGSIWLLSKVLKKLIFIYNFFQFLIASMEGKFFFFFSDPHSNFPTDILKTQNSNTFICYINNIISTSKHKKVFTHSSTHLTY